MLQSDSDDDDNGDDDSSVEEDEPPTDVLAQVLDFEEHEFDHEMAFVTLKRVSCFAHTLQVVVRKFDEESLLTEACT